MRVDECECTSASGRLRVDECEWRRGGGAARGAVIKHVYTINIESIDLIDGRSVGRNLFGGDVFQNSEKIVLILKTVDSLEHSVIDC